MTTSLPPVAHAMQRAKERYGIDLSWEDLKAICLRCKAGEGRTDRTDDGAHFHLIVFRERVLWVIYRRPTAVDPDGIVVTIMPPKAEAMRGRDSNHIMRRNGHQRRRKVWQ